MVGIRSAILYSMTSKYSMRLLGLVTTMILARLLTPAEIGTFAIASSIVMLLSEFRMLGAGVYLIREKELTDQKIRSSFGLTIIISWGLGLAVLGSAPFVAQFYELSELATLFIILSLSFFISPYISIPTSLLSRDLHYRPLMIAQLLSTLANMVTTVGLVLLGFSYFSLAWGIGAASLVKLLATLYYRPRGMPWMPSFRNMAAVVKVGIYSSLTNILKKFQTTAPDLVIGKLGTTTQVGVFSRGMGFVDFVSQTIEMGITPVALPYLSNVRRQGGDMVQAYVKAALLMGSLTWPVLAVASLTAFPAIRLFFGDQWDAAAPIAAILAYWALLRSVHTLSAPLLLAVGREVWMVTKEAIVFVIFVAGIVVAFPYGLESVAWALVVSSAVNVVLTSLILKWSIGLGLMSFIGMMMPNIILTAACWVAAYLIGLFIDFETASPFLSIGVVAAILPWVWLGTAVLLRHEIYQELKGLVVRRTKQTA